MKNISNDLVALWEYEIESRPWFYEFDRDAVLEPGQEFTLWIGRAPTARRARATAAGTSARCCWPTARTW